MAFLKVESSLSNRKWVGPSREDERIGLSIAQTHNISQITALLLAKRNIKISEVETFLTPKIRDSMPDPYVLKDMKEASERLVQAINRNEKICVFADYDVDGTVSASILYLWLKSYNIIPEIYIPDRKKEGYGPNKKAITELSGRNDLIICVDCGTVAHEAIAVAKNFDTDTIIFDHHLSDEVLPPAVALVNPRRYDETGEIDYLCASGVVFLVLVAVNRLLRSANQPTYEIINFLDLIALATVADVVPLKELNRALVSQGLKVIGRRLRPGLVALGDLAGLREKPSTSHLSFMLAPRINAAGRLADATLAVQLFISESLEESYSIANRLNELNEKRKSIENTIFEEALALLDGRPHNESFHWVASENWHPGVIGIIAAKLKDHLNMPVIVLSIDKNGIAVGSARSVPGVDIGAAIRRVQRANYLLSGGGHKMAAGLKCKRVLIEKSMHALEKEINQQPISKTGRFGELEIDSLITAKGVSPDLVEEINAVGPFGLQNPFPRVAIANCQIKRLKVLKGKHLKFLCEDPTKKTLEAIFFNSNDSRAGQELKLGLGESFHLCGKLEINEWGGYRRVVLQVDDVSIAN